MRHRPKDPQKQEEEEEEEEAEISSLPCLTYSVRGTGLKEQMNLLAFNIAHKSSMLLRVAERPMICT